MQYRPFGRLDWQGSALGFGTARLPTIGGDNAQVDVEKTTRLLRHAIDHGVNYVDTGYPYHGGNSGGSRGAWRCATATASGSRSRQSCPIRWSNTLADCDRILDEQLDRLRDRPHRCLSAARVERPSGLVAQDAGSGRARLGRGRGGRRASGLSGVLASTTRTDVFKEIVDAYDDWSMCQIQYNYMDVEHQAGTKGLKHAAPRGWPWSSWSRCWAASWRNAAARCRISGTAPRQAHACRVGAAVAVGPARGVGGAERDERDGARRRRTSPARRHRPPAR